MTFSFTWVQIWGDTGQNLLVIYLYGVEYSNYVQLKPVELQTSGNEKKMAHFHDHGNNLTINTEFKEIIDENCSHMIICI